jgi:hypothetical protein
MSSFVSTRLFREATLFFFAQGAKIGLYFGCGGQKEFTQPQPHNRRTTKQATTVSSAS